MAVDIARANASASPGGTTGIPRRLASTPLSPTSVVTKGTPAAHASSKTLDSPSPSVAGNTNRSMLWRNASTSVIGPIYDNRPAKAT